MHNVARAAAARPQVTRTRRMPGEHTHAYAATGAGGAAAHCYARGTQLCDQLLLWAKALTLERRVVAERHAGSVADDRAHDVRAGDNEPVSHLPCICRRETHWVVGI